MGRLFGTDGVRGVVGSELTPELALRLGRAIGAYFGLGSRVLVGRDVRSGGDLLVKAVVSGLLSEGVKVYYSGLLPTPALQYAVKTGPYDGGVMVTASHNPPEYNGIKVIGGDGIEVPREDERVIEEYYFKGSASRLEWRSLAQDSSIVSGVIDDYIEAIKSQVDVDLISKAGFKAVVDCGNSVGSLVTPRLLTELGVRVVTLNCDLNPHFPGREPEPTPTTLETAGELVKIVKADFGVGHDGDADRAIIIDNNGEAHWGDRTGALLTLFASRHWRDLPRRTYTGVSSSTLVEDYLRPHGIDVVWTPVGSVVISRMIQRDGGAISGFEENGGYMHTPHHIVRDGAMTAALLAYMMAEEEVDLATLYSRLPRYYSIKTKIPATRQEALCGVEAVKEAYSGYRQVTIDGVKVFGEDFWVLVRPSGTEPVLRIMLEAKTPERARSLLEEVKGIVSSKCLGKT
ncbi:MAG: phosphoglucosamine mutase [Desulfurococcales archaeon]|nr:phosphoglucosamine mutase [Desulfurococcales archaeon]